MNEFFRRANRQKYSSYFYGDTDATLAKLQYKLSASSPGHRIVGTFSPPFRPLTSQEDQDAIDRINAARPDVLWVGLGAPRQDRWIHERLPSLKVPVAIGVGAAFSFIAGTVQRCPEWMGSMGLEWAYRFAKEPKKLWKPRFDRRPQIPFPSRNGACRTTQLLGTIHEFRLISRQLSDSTLNSYIADSCRALATHTRHLVLLCGVRPHAAVPEPRDPLGLGGSA